MHRTSRMALLATLAVLLSSSVTLAAAPPWTYVEAGYLNVDPDDLDSGDAWFAGGSFGFLKNFHASARYVDGDYTDNADYTYWEFGGGWHGLLGEKADLVAEVSWVDTEVSSSSDDGLGLTGGVRWKVLEFLELDGFVNWVDYDSGSEESYEARAIFDVWRIGVGVSAEFADSVNQYNVFARFAFGKK